MRYERVAEKQDFAEKELKLKHILKPVSTKRYNLTTKEELEIMESEKYNSFCPPLPL